MEVSTYISKKEINWLEKISQSVTEDGTVAISVSFADIPLEQAKDKVCVKEAVDFFKENYQDKGLYQDFWYEDIISTWSEVAATRTIFDIKVTDVVFNVHRGPYCGMHYQRLMDSINYKRWEKRSGIPETKLSTDYIDMIETYYPEKKVGVWYEEFPYTGWNKTELDFFITDFNSNPALKVFAEDFMTLMSMFKALFDDLYNAYYRIPTFEEVFGYLQEQDAIMLVEYNSTDDDKVFADISIKEEV